MSLCYADTSAVIKLPTEEVNSRALAAFYDSQAEAEWVAPQDQRLVSSDQPA